MKKLLFAAAAVIFLAGSAFAQGSVVNLKAGLDAGGNVGLSKDGSGNVDVKSGFSFIAEYLFKLNEVVRLGAGVEYQLPREIDEAGFDAKISYMPVYASIEISPIKPVRELYFKGNLGYNVLFDFEYNGLWGSGESNSGGVYLGLGAGYVFDFGLILEGMYGIYHGSMKWKTGLTGDVGYTYAKVALNVGYRFNI